jgi:hypothetical protein
MLAAFLTIARGWIVAGRPGKKIRSDSYAEWLRALRGMMQWAGFQGSFGSGTSAVSVSADDEEWHTFLVELNKVFGTYLFTVKDIV